jgi:hypothetical protein
VRSAALTEALQGGGTLDETMAWAWVLGAQAVETVERLVDAVALTWASTPTATVVVLAAGGLPMTGLVSGLLAAGLRAAGLEGTGVANTRPAVTPPLGALTAIMHW